VKTLSVWASAGYVVAAPDYPLSHTGVPGGTDYSESPAQAHDVAFVIDQISALAHGGDDILSGRLISDSVGIAGQSFGAMTSLLAGFHTCCAIPSVRAVVSFAGAAVPDAASGALAAEAAARPLLSIHGDADPTLPYAGEHDAWLQLHGDKYFLTLPGGGHDDGFFGGLSTPRIGWSRSSLSGSSTGTSRTIAPEPSGWTRRSLLPGRRWRPSNAGRKRRYAGVPALRRGCRFGWFGSVGVPRCSGGCGLSSSVFGVELESVGGGDGEEPVSRRTVRTVGPIGWGESHGPSGAVDDAVVMPTQQGEVRCDGFAVIGVVFDDVVCIAPAGWCVTSREDASAVADVERASHCAAREPGPVAYSDRHAELVEDHFGDVGVADEELPFRWGEPHLPATGTRHGYSDQVSDARWACRAVPVVVQAVRCVGVTVGVSPVRVEGFSEDGVEFVDPVGVDHEVHLRDGCLCGGGVGCSSAADEFHDCLCTEFVAGRHLEFRALLGVGTPLVPQPVGLGFDEVFHGLAVDSDEHAVQHELVTNAL